MKSCTGCGAEALDDVRFCSSCGRSLSDHASAEISSGAPNPAPDSETRNWHDTPTIELLSASPPAEEDPHPPQLGAFAPGTVLAKRYRIVALLGRGGMGEVYRAEDLKLGNTVALKFLAPALQSNAAALAHLHDEVRNARQISHPNVCRVYDISEVDGQHFLIMEYVDGEDLASLLRRIGRLPADKALETSQQICAGLSAAHDAGLLHRDLKPANIMLDGRGRARLTDFGLALSSAISATRRTTAGTPPYMAPEQIARGETSIQSDIYSLGLVLYEIFTGRFAYKTPDIEAPSPSDPEGWLQIHQQSIPAPPSDLVSDINPHVSETILACLQKDPSARPASVQQVAALLPSAIGSAARATPLSTSGTRATRDPASGLQEKVPEASRLATRLALLTAAAIAIAALVYGFIARQKHLPFENYTIGRATDSQHVRVTAISPDGNYIASVVTDPKGAQSLWVHNIPTGSERAILQDDSIQYEDLLFSPDASYIYYSTPSSGENDSDDDEYRVPVFGGKPSRVFQALGGPLTFIGNTGRVCLYREYADTKTWKFLSASADGGDERVLFTAKGTSPHVPTCSPDAASAILEDDAGKLESIKFATGARQPFGQFSNGRWFYHLQWDAKGKGLFAITVQKSHFSGQLAWISWPGGKLQEITNDLNNYSGISVTADSKMIATTQKEHNTRFVDLALVKPDVGLAKPDGAPADPAQPQEHEFSSLEWFTWIDNHRILVSGEDSTLKMADLLSDQTTTLNTAKDHFFFQPSLCGADAIVASGNTADQQNPGIYKMQLDGSVSMRLTQGVQDLWPQCSADGKQLFYSDDHDDTQAHVLHLPIAGGTPQLLGNGVYFEVASAAKMLAVHYFSKESRVQFLSTDSFQPTRSVNLPPSASHVFALAPDGKTIYYFVRKESDATLWQMPTDTAVPAQPKQIANFPGRAVKYLQASPDGQHLGVVVQKPTSQVVLLREAR